METNNIITRQQAEIDAANAECVHLAEALKHVQGENGKLMGEIAALNIELAGARGAALEEVAAWYSVTGWLMDEEAVPDGIRDLKGAPSAAKAESQLRDAVTILRGALVNAECAIKGREHTGFITKALVATDFASTIAGAASEAPPLSAPAEQQKQTDLSKRLRDYATSGWKYSNNIVARVDLIAACDEIDRYYTGMLNWKACAEAKDRAPASSKAAEGSIGDDAHFRELLANYRNARDMHAKQAREDLTGHIDSIIAAARTGAVGQGWISVEDELPSTAPLANGHVPTVVVHWKRDALADNLSQVDTSNTVFLAYNKDKFTHWMPLPAAPLTAQVSGQPGGSHE